jgi:hypothetical protein
LRLVYGTQSSFWRLGSIHRWKNRGPTPRRQAANTTERWRASYGSWLVSFGCQARVKSCLTLHCDTTEEPTALTHEAPALPGSRMNRSLWVDPTPLPIHRRLRLGAAHGVDHPQPRLRHPVVQRIERAARAIHWSCCGRGGGCLPLGRRRGGFPISTDGRRNTPCSL